MPYDLFIGYARRDNVDGRVTELVDRIADDYRQFSGKEASPFSSTCTISAAWRTGGTRFWTV